MDFCGELWGIMCNFDAKSSLINVRMRFLGNIEGKIDAKGRAFLPVVFRKVLTASGEENLVMRKDVFRNCLTLYPESVWNAQLDTLRKRRNRWNATHQQLFRQFASDVELITPDGNGRILIPKRFLLMARIEQAVSFIGVDDVIEIWSPEEQQQSQLSPEEFSKGMEQLMSDDPWLFTDSE